VKLIVGLGNPGDQYHQTRHNVGFMVMDNLARMINGEWLMNKYVQSLVINHQSLVLAKPQSFMNKSGEAVKLLVSYYESKTSDITVIHDDLDIRLGEYKIQLGKGPKVHNGINSIEKSLGTEQFWRVRVGIDNRDPENRIPGESYVLQQFSLLELEALDKVFENIKLEIGKYV
jgi:peptidyl-tRNA hydrolase, PTH1 family